jgi:hypothetical protein
VRQSDKSLGESPNRVRRRLWFWLVVAVCVVLAVLFIARSVPVLDVNKHQRVNESVTASRLRRLKDLQNKYAASYPAKGFTCQLHELKAATPVGDMFDPNEFLLTGAQSGYKFAVTGCRIEPNGVVTQYQVTATPLVPGKSGFRAFCTDQTGAMWYDSNGSPEQCLASRRPLQ